jgi:hypothetical protein
LAEIGSVMYEDLLTDMATIQTRTQSGTNDLGEPVYSVSETPVAGMLVVRPKQVWTGLGLAQGTEAVFICAKEISLPEGATLTIEGRTYRRVTVSRRKDLWGDEGITRLILSEGPQ